MLYCTGTHTVAPTYKRSQGYIGKFNRNYDIAETRTFKADTGFLTFAMANWADELFRSKSIHVVNFKDGHPNVGKEVIVTDSKSEYNNNDESMPRFTFSYQYEGGTGEMLHYKGWLVHHVNWRGGYVRLRNPRNRAIRALPQIFIIQINNKRVYL